MFIPPPLPPVASGHGTWDVEVTSCVYVFASEYATAQIWLTLRETSATPCRSGYGDKSISGLSIGVILVPMANSPDPGP